MENTLPAAEAAVARNFAIECDLQPTADGRVVVFHDHVLDRLTEATGPLVTRSLAELKAIRLRDTEARIPTLEELLDAVDGRVPLIIEFKSHWDGDRRLEQAVAPILANYSGPVAVMSFDPASMAAMRRLAPTLPRGLIADHFDPGSEGDGSPLQALRPPPPARGGHCLAEFRLLRHQGIAGERAPHPPPLRHAADNLDRAHAGRPGEGAAICRPDNLRGLRSGRKVVAGTACAAGRRP